MKKIAVGIVALVGLVLIQPTFASEQKSLVIIDSYYKYTFKCLLRQLDPCKLD